MHAAFLELSTAIISPKRCVMVFLPSLFCFCLFFFLFPRLLAHLLSFYFISLFSFEPHNSITPEKQNTCLARNVHIQQVLQPVDPSIIPGLTKTHLDSEGDEVGPLAPALQPSELTQLSSTGNPPRGAAYWEQPRGTTSPC